MDSNRFAIFALTALLALPAAAYNHVNTVTPTVQGPFNVACSNVAQDASRIAPGLNSADYWEGRFGHYVNELLTDPGSGITYDVRVPFDPFVYPGNFGRRVDFFAVVCYPTPKSNTDPNYALPGSGEIVPHMQPAGSAPKLIGVSEYLSAFNVAIDPPPPGPMRMPLIIYSHGLGGSPISSGYLQTIALLASHGFMVAGTFHGDSRFSKIRIEDFADAVYVLAAYNFIVEMSLMRPLSLVALTDKLLDDPNYSVGINREQIGGFGASMGGEAMLHLLGANITTNAGLGCHDAPRDTRIKAAVAFVPYAGQTFLPAFCSGQSGVDSITTPFLALSGTADVTAPIKMVDSALRRMKGSRYLVELAGVPHEFKAEYAGDLMTWMVTFYRAYLQNDADAMGKFIGMNTVAGGPSDRMRLDWHVPTTPTGSSKPVVEFRNTILNHYFMTIDSQNIADILAGRYGQGWELTGQSFKGWPAGEGFYAPNVVCRFYGGYVPGGPNSHFYTAVADECNKVLSGFYGPWGYEGTGFYSRAAAVDAAQKCPDRFLGVNRAYNNRWWANDSNHRFTTSDSTIRDLEGEGWSYEGIVMCTPP